MPKSRQNRGGCRSKACGWRQALSGAARAEESERNAAQTKKKRDENAWMKEARFSRGFRAHGCFPPAGLDEDGERSLADAILISFAPQVAVPGCYLFGRANQRPLAEAGAAAFTASSG